jgi:hypothetical protein
MALHWRCCSSSARLTEPIALKSYVLFLFEFQLCV